MQTELQKLPSVDKLIQHAQLLSLIETHHRSLVVEACRSELTAVRQKIMSGQSVPHIDDLVMAITTRLTAMTRPSLQSVINATGVIIHTNLGRALLSERAQTAMQQAAMAYSNLEYDLAAGQRGSRYLHAADLLCRLSGAEAAVVVNNNAGAVILTLTALAKNLEVLISRGQLIEIGGGFRIPDIMAQSGARLKEVGTTNRTYIRDFEESLDRWKTGLILNVHPSNYQIVGFTIEPTLAELAELSRGYNIPLMQDLGSGTLLDTTLFGLAHEPTIQESLAAGADIVTASGDKLLGGPQAGLIFGKAHLIEQLRKHPLIRALRVDKITLAALQATLLAYLEDNAIAEIPVWQMIAATVPQLAQRVETWRGALQEILPPNGAIQLLMVDSRSTVGGGSLPGQTLPTVAMAISTHSIDDLARKLRQATPPIIVRLEDHRLLLDPRTILPAQDSILLDVLSQALLHHHDVDLSGN